MNFVIKNIFQIYSLLLFQPISFLQVNLDIKTLTTVIKAFII